MGKGEKPQRKSPRKRPTDHSESQDTERHRRTWKDDEVKRVLDYMKSTIQKGGQIEKPNARAYYKKMAGDLNLLGCDAVSLVNKVRSLKEGYIKAKAWRDQTGQGVDEGSIEDEIKKRCRFWESLDEIYSERVSITPPYSAETSATGSTNSDEEICSDNEDNVGPSSPFKEFSPPPLKKGKTGCKKGISPKSADFSVIVKRRQDIQRDEVKNEAARIELEKQRSDLESSVQTEKLELDKERFRLESTMRKEELEFRRDQLKLEREKLERDHELERFRIEQNVKLQIELAKISKK